MIKILKDPNIQKKKPTLNLKPNHYSYASEGGRYWNAELRGTAVKDGYGWYKHKEATP